MSTVSLAIPRIEDEIERAWISRCDDGKDDVTDEVAAAAFAAGFRAARTFTLTGGVAHVGR